jgi:ribonuclease G
MRARSTRRDLLPFNWFRRKKQSDEEQAAAPVEPAPKPDPRPVDGQPAGEAGDQRQRRRRGSRGGRGRTRKPAEAQAEKKPDKKPAEKEKAPERKPAAQKGRKQSTRRRAQPRRAPLPPAKRELLVSVDVGEQRVAVLEDGVVAEVYLERPEKRSIAGNIYKGVVDNVLPGMEAAFVEIGLEKNGFLYVDEIVTPELEGTRRNGKKIQDLLSRGQEILVQAVKDPMKTKGARLTTEISLPGRFVVYVPHGEGLGVSRRLGDDERNRLRDIVKEIAPKQGGVIVRTAAEGASAEDVALDLDFLQRLWKAIQTQAKGSKAPTLLYQEAELPLRVVRDLFTEDFEKAYVDHDRAYKRIVGYLKKTSPHMVERVERYREKERLFDALGVEEQIRSTLSRRVDLPSGGYLVFDYAEAFTVIDVNTGRFVGGRGKNSNARLEDTITKNNLEAVKEVVRQLRLRDIGGIIVIDFIDMANPKNRASVEDALKTELERDRTKTYVVEISPLGLVEMTRQNVTDGPREILTRKCPTCAGDGIVYSERSAAIDAERRLRALTSHRSKAFKVGLNAHVASMVIGPGGTRLAEIESQVKKRFFVEGAEDVPVDFFEVIQEGTIAALQPEAPVAEGATVQVKLVEIGKHDATAAMGSLEGLTVCVGEASKFVGRKVKVEIVRVLDGTAYATLVDPAPPKPAAPISAELQAEKPTRAPRKKAADEGKPEAIAEEEEVEAELEAVAEEEPAAEPEEGAAEGDETPKKKTRRGSRGGRGRKKRPATAVAASADGQEASAEAPAVEPKSEPAADGNGKAPKIHVPDPELGREPEPEEVSANGGEPAEGGEDAAKPRRKTRRGSRGGRNRRKKVPTAAEAQPEGDSEG